MQFEGGQRHSTSETDSLTVSLTVTVSQAGPIIHQSVSQIGHQTQSCSQIGHQTQSCYVNHAAAEEVGALQTCCNTCREPLH